MADISNNWSDGNIKWSSKKSSQQDNIPIPVPVLPNVISGLKSTDILTDLQGVSVKIVKLNNIVGQIAIKGYTSHDINGNIITVYSSDELPLILEFISIAEALAADTRLTTCLNGGIVGGGGGSVTPIINGV